MRNFGKKLIMCMFGENLKLKIMSFLKWHKEFTEKKIKFYGLSKLSNYQLMWLSWGKGLVMGIIIAYFIFH